MRIETARLTLIDGSPMLLEAAIESPERLAAALGARVPSSWPPDYIDAHALGWTIRMRESLPESAGWWMYFVLRKERASMPTLIGTAGYKGPPTLDASVEIGYSIVADEQRRGYATEAAQAIIDRAFADPRVTRVTAETLVDGAASQGVLRRCAFVGPEPGSEEGVVRFTLPRSQALDPGSSVESKK
jgi:RimJ/RimL family protein N-acetyltransferase